MKTLIAGAALLLAATIPAQAQTNVSISVGQPGFYGRIDLGDFGPPPVVYAQPVIVQRSVHYEAAPVYLRVPEGQRRHWSRYCGRYNACGQRVFFVQDNWYTHTYAPRYRDRHHGPARVVYRHEEGHDRGGHEHGNGHGHDHGDDHGRGHDRDHGHGHDHGRGH